MVLTVKQKQELNQAVFEYLKNQNFSQTAEVFEVEADIRELEQSLEQLNNEITQSQKTRKNLKKIDINQFFPKLPAKHILQGHRSSVNSLSFHPEFSQLASASEDATIKLWDIEAGKFEATLKGHTSSINYISYDQTGQFLASASSDLSIKIWDLNQQNTCIKTLNGHEHTVSCVIFISLELILSCSRDKTIKLWDICTGYNIKTYIGHNDWVRCISSSSDGIKFASGSNDQNILIWDRDQNNPILQLIGHEHVIGHDNWVRALCLHHSSKFLYSCSDDKTIRIWDLSIGKCYKKLEAHSHFVSNIQTTNKYLTLATCSVNNSIKIWELQ